VVGVRHGNGVSVCEHVCVRWEGIGARCGKMCGQGVGAEFCLTCRSGGGGPGASSDSCMPKEK
jgi:hypothetical protein